MSDQIPAMLVCMRASSPSRLPTSIEQACSECRQPIWVSPASMKVARDHKAQLICMECLIERAQKGGDRELKIESPTPEQLEEIERHR